MKVLIYSILAGLLLLSHISCKKDDPSSTAMASGTPEALAENDNKSGGIYKGTFVSPNYSGIIKVVLQGGTKNIFVSINGTSKTLTSTSLDSWASGQPIAGAVFTSGDWQVTLNIPANGADPLVNLTLPGTPYYYFRIKKEMSTAQVRVYEGTYSGDDSGIWNFVINGTMIEGIYANGQGSGDFGGTINGTNIDLKVHSSTDIVKGAMTTDGNSASGTWKDSDGTGTWKATRKL